MSDTPSGKRGLYVAPLVAFAGAFAGFASFFFRLPILWDADSYYHLAVARLYAQHGPAATIPWARFSLLGHGGDKEWLFHLLLVPFAAFGDPAIGGRIALALLNAALFTLIGALAARAIGAWGWILPLWLWIAAPPFFARTARLRPDLLALALILIAIPIAARRSWRLLGLIAFLFTLSYTAFHVFLALSIAWIAVTIGRRIDTRALIAAVRWPLAGTIAGLFLRPAPVATLHIWYVQNVLFFFEKTGLDVGNEIAAPNASRILTTSLGWLATLAILAVVAWRERADSIPSPSGRGCREAAGEGRAAAQNVLRATAQTLAIAAAFFALLFIFMARMALYAYPLVTLAILFAIAPRLAAARRAIIPIALLAGMLIGIPLAANPALMRLLTAKNVTSEADWAAFGRAVPEGSRIAARWGDAEVYALWAPQGRYLNVLDPIFMDVIHPREYAAQRALFDGTDPDPVTTARTILDSNFIALDWSDAPPSLIARLKRDPRLKVRYGGYNVLLEIVPASLYPERSEGSVERPR